MIEGPPRVLVVEDFLSPEEHAMLLAFASDSNSSHAGPQVNRPDETVDSPNRSSRPASSAEAGAGMVKMLEERLRAIFPNARREAGVAPFRLGTLEYQITAHHDGDFFALHDDIGLPWHQSSARRLSFVYYFHEQPRQFSGGQLRLHGHRSDDVEQLGADATFRTVEPADNTIAFFPSDALHEVCPISVPGAPDAPGATQFTLTGWFHDADHHDAPPPMDRETRTALAARYAPSFTDTGFLKAKTPAPVHRALRAAYEARSEQLTSESVDEEYLPTGAPDFIDIEDIKAQFALALQSVHEDWCGAELVPTAVYGLRIYRSGQTLLPHTDVLESHVISSIVHIAHETNEPWPLWITDLQGNEHEVVLEEGEMLLYEGARCPHARLRPLNGDAYCSLFVHYRPVDWNITHWTLIEQAVADGATDVLPPSLRPSER